MAWWAWLLVDLFIGLLAVGVTTLVAMDLWTKIKHLRRVVTEVVDQMPRIDR